MNLREYERESIRRFVQSAADEGYLSGTVIDIGCGKQPYRTIVEEAGGLYYGYDRADFPGNVSGGDVGEWLPTYASALCTQVLQFIPNPLDFLTATFMDLKAGGHLVMTYVTHWPEVEPDDLHRHTKAGMERLLAEAGFAVVRHERRGVLQDPAFPTAPMKRVTATGEEFAIGYGVVARA